MSNKWQGTAVPNSGYVEKVYVNTNLSPEEVMNIINDAQLTFIEGFGLNYFVALTDSNVDNGQQIMIIVGEGMIAFGDQRTTLFDSADLIGAGIVGWNPDFNGVVEFNANVIAGVDGYPVGAENSKLSSLFSITPFVKAEDKPKYDWLRELFINEAKAVLPKCTCNGGSSDDVTYEETENEAGGITVTIGSKEE